MVEKPNEKKGKKQTKCFGKSTQIKHQQKAKKEKNKMKWKQVSEQSCMTSCEVRSVDTIIIYKSYTNHEQTSNTIMKTYMQS